MPAKSIIDQYFLGNVAPARTLQCYHVAIMLMLWGHLPCASVASACVLTADVHVSCFPHTSYSSSRSNRKGIWVARQWRLPFLLPASARGLWPGREKIFSLGERLLLCTALAHSTHNGCPEEKHIMAPWCTFRYWLAAVFIFRPLQKNCFNIPTQ